jgi:hypothetical protein
VTVNTEGDSSSDPGSVTVGTTTGAVVFDNMQMIVGADGNNNTFQPGTVGGLTFMGGGGGASNTLDLSQATVSAPFTVDTTGGACSSGTLIGNASATFYDCFTGMSTIDGSPQGTTFQPGTATGVTFNGASGSVGENTIDLTGEPAADFSSLVVGMFGATPCGGAGQGEITSTGPAGNLGDCFTNVGVVNGASNVPTDFQPDPTPPATPSPVPVFAGNDSATGGSTVDLARFTSPTAHGNTLAGLTLSLGGNTQADPGSVTATVNALPVTFAHFHGIDAAVGSNTLATAFDPGATQGVSLVGITKAPQSIMFTSTPPSHARVGRSYAAMATGGGSGNAVTFTIDPSSGSRVCTLRGPATVRFGHAGVCVLDANQGGNSEYAAATQVKQLITVVTVTPSVTIVSNKLVYSHGVVAVTLECSAAVTSCRGTATILYKKRGLDEKLGSAPFTLSGGERKTVAITVLGHALESVAKMGSVKVEVETTLVFRGGERATSSRRLTLTLP